MRPFHLIVFSLFLLYLSPGSRALYFYLKEGDQKCFIRELPDKTLFVGHYRCKPIVRQGHRGASVNSSDHSMLVKIKNPLDKIVLSREYRSRGRFTFTSHEPGPHTICMHSKVTSEKILKVDFSMQIGEHAINYADVAKKEKLSKMQLKYKQLNKKAAEIIKELDYQRYREEQFRDSTESISRRVLLWSVAQTAVLILMAVWQMENLRKFFESKKLV